MKRLLFSCCFAAAIWMGRADAVVTYTFSDSPDGVVLEYSGSLNTTELVFQGNLSSSLRYVEINGLDAGPGERVIDFQNMRPHPDSSFDGVSRRYSTDSFTFDLNMSFATGKLAPSVSEGDTFGFYIFQQSGQFKTWMNLPYKYESGGPINGRQVFAGQTLASMGLELADSFEMRLPGGEKIVGQVVPEPSALAPGAVAALAGLCRRRRRG